ncbi:nitroreductase/quinone reductase family protein [Mycobacterium sp. UM_Kg1]|uniref:nitroreductase/quinone reductase family protein n=1 Tax=Mycobacterium sp. UM_Kg1 TaxID=1545691 RepID=UPI00061AAF99|nr:nitroreductase/quinone reductase family protein [Mycobacterium sp. UM_Kg1]
MNGLLSWRIRRGGKLLGNTYGLVLTTVGRRTGMPRSTPVSYFPDGDGRWLIVASAAGAARNPSWFLNLAAHPDQAQIELPGRTVAVRAEQLHGHQRDVAWQQIASTSKLFTRYAQKTDRELPVILLTERRGARPS